MATLMNNQNEQLFTELTPQEAAVVEGGFRIRLGRLTASSLTYDDRDHRFGPRADEPILYVKNQKKWGWKPLFPGKTGQEIGTNVNINGFGDIRFREYDRGRRNDDHISFVKSKTFGSLGLKGILYFRGAGAHYKLNYSLNP